MRMFKKQKRKALSHVGILAWALFTAPSCGVAPPEMPATLPPLKQNLECLPEGAAIISAHRATIRDWNYPENALGGLYKLKEQNYLMAEIDVARTIDGTHFLFHDGVWDDISTGKGAVAQTKGYELDSILLKSRKGNLSDERPPLLEQALRFAKNKQLYLEIDFKSSANYKDVITLIRQIDMAQNVILISYSKGQRDRLAKLAPDMLISASPDDAKPGDLIWAGKGVTRTLPRDTKNNLIIGRVARPEHTEGLHLAKQQAHILVTDDANRYQPITGLTRQSRSEYIECLRSLSPDNDGG